MKEELSGGFRVPVFDQGNPERLLGFLVNPPALKNHMDKLVAFVTPFRRLWCASDHLHPLDINFDRDVVHFTIRETTQLLGWVTKFVLTTDAPLSQLRLVETFRLPCAVWEDAE